MSEWGEHGTRARRCVESGQPVEVLVSHSISSGSASGFPTLTRTRECDVMDSSSVSTIILGLIATVGTGVVLYVVSKAKW